MPRIDLNVVIVCGSGVVELPTFVTQLTESYLPTLSVSEQNGCTVTRTLVRTQARAGHFEETIDTSSSPTPNFNSEDPNHLQHNVSHHPQHQHQISKDSAYARVA